MRGLTLFLLALLCAFALDTPIHDALAGAAPGVEAAGRLVTWVGKTDWQALVLLSVMLAAALFRADAESAARAERILRLAVAAFLLILLTGIAVQVLKYAFGRPRPAHLGALSPLTFAPFSFQSGWNAFPSGHATTMAAWAVLWARLCPRFWLWGWGLAAIVGISRVLVGAHYPSDVVAGLALGGVLAGWLLDRWIATDALHRLDQAHPLPRARFGPLSGLAAIPRAFADMLRATVRRAE